MKNPPNKSSYKSSYKLVILTAVFLVLVNIIVLAGVAYNRSGEPIASLKLTERELALPYRSRKSTENSGLALRLKWNIVPPEPYTNKYDRYNLHHYGNPKWLTIEKLTALGINVNDNSPYENDSSSGYSKYKTDELIIVFEYNSESYTSSVKKAEEDIQHYRNSAKVNADDEKLAKKLVRHETSLNKLKNTQSRLIAIDAGRDIEALKQKYNDSSKYLFLRGEIKRNWKKGEFTARIKRIFNDSVHVALPESEMFSGMKRSKRYGNEEKPRYEVELMLGERLEVWVGGVGQL